MKTMVKLGVTSLFVAASGVVLLTPQAGAACTANAAKPTYSSSTKVLKGTGGQGTSCSGGSSATVLLRHQHFASPDTTVAQSDGVGNFSLSVSKANPENGTYYTETRSSNGSNQRSADYNLG